MNHFHQSIKGYFDFEDIYAQAVADAPPGGVLVEVGSYLGKSSAFLAVEAINSGKPLSIYCVDVWTGGKTVPQQLWATIETLGGDAFPQWCKNMAPVLRRVKPLRMESTTAAQFFVDESVDFVFIDADHAYESVIEDIRAWLPKVKPGGTLAGHDMTESWPGVQMAVRELLPHFEQVGNSWRVSV